MNLKHNESFKCEHCGKDILRKHKNTARDSEKIVPINHSAIVKSEIIVEKTIATSFYESGYSKVILKNKVKCGKKICGKHTTIVTLIEGY